MGSSLNKVQLIGNLGADPDTRHTAGGSAVCNISVATSEQWKDKQTGERNEKTEWHRVVFFGRVAEIADEYLRKGSKVYIEGRLQTRKWEDREGVDRWSTEVIGNELKMLDSRGGDRENQQGSYKQSSQPSNTAPQKDSLEDDIPF